MDGQAQEAPSTTEDIAQWLVDNPDADRNDEESQEEQTDDSTQEDTEEAETEAESPDQDESEEEESDATEDQPSDRKFKVTVKGEDGADLDLEVDEKELIAGYKRHSDYTRKTQELARREEQALDVVKAEVRKAQNYALQQSQLAQAVVLQLAGIRSPQEMAALAQSDQAAYVAEKSRMELIQAAVGNLQAQAQQIQSQQNAAAERSRKAGVSEVSGRDPVQGHRQREVAPPVRRNACRARCSHGAHERHSRPGPDPDHGRGCCVPRTAKEND